MITVLVTWNTNRVETLRFSSGTLFASWAGEHWKDAKSFLVTMKGN